MSARGLQRTDDHNFLIGRFKGKLEKLSERQDAPLKNLGERSIRILREVICRFGCRKS